LTNHVFGPILTRVGGRVVSEPIERHVPAG